MSDIRWCDFGGHPFSVNDEGAERMASTRNNADGARTYYDCCGPCKADGQMGIKSFTAPSKAKAVESADATIVKED